MDTDLPECSLRTPCESHCQRLIYVWLTTRNYTSSSKGSSPLLLLAAFYHVSPHQFLHALRANTSSSLAPTSCMNCASSIYPNISSLGSPVFWQLYIQHISTHIVIIPMFRMTISSKPPLPDILS